MVKPPEGSNQENRDIWILVRGLSRSAAHWGEFPQRLEKTVPNSEVSCLDLPGNGIYHDLSTPISIPEITEFLKRDFERILGERIVTGQSRPKCFLVSLSLGSMVAIDWTSRYPADFAGCTLMNTSSALSPVYQRMRFQSLPLLVRIFAERNPKNREKIILKLTSQFEERNSGVIPNWVELAKSCPISASNTLRQLLAAKRFRMPQKAPLVPMMLLSSQKDKLVDPRCTQAIRQKWNIPWKENPEAGHDLPLDAPDWVLEQILAWRSQLKV